MLTGAVGIHFVHWVGWGGAQGGKFVKSEIFEFLVVCYAPVTLVGLVVCLSYVRKRYKMARDTSCEWGQAMLGASASEEST